MKMPRVGVLVAGLLLSALVACGGGTTPPLPSGALDRPPNVATPPILTETPQTPPKALSPSADNFSDSSTGWDSTGTAHYVAGKLQVGIPSPAALFVPSPVGFNGSAAVSATASIVGPGAAVIGLFCDGSTDLSSAYVSLVDLANATAAIGRYEGGRLRVIGGSVHINSVGHVSGPLPLRMTCTRTQGGEQIKLSLEGKAVASGVDPSPLVGPVGGLYFEYTKAGTKGVFDNFDMIPITAAQAGK